MEAYGFLMNLSLSQEKMIKNSIVSHLNTIFEQIFFLQIYLGILINNFNYLKNSFPPIILHLADCAQQA